MAKKSGIFESLEAEVIHGAEEYVKDKVKRKAMKIGEISMFILLGFFLISIGLAYLIGYYFSFLNNGLNFLILGVVFVIVSYILSM